MPPPRTSFDLLTEAWLPVQLLSDGTRIELSLLGVLERAHELRRLVGDLPTQEFALLRLLLAALHDALDGPEDLDHWTELWEADTLPVDDLRDYLEEHRDRFDLLHPTTPFLQVPDLRTAGDDISRLDRIVADIPNNERFFTMRALGVDRLDYAEAARWLIHAHAFDPAGIKSGTVGDPRVKGGKVYPQGIGWTGNLGGVHVEGGDLRRTLLLNLVAADTPGLRINALGEPDEDRPAWRRPPCGPGAAGRSAPGGT
ncbi:type I-E CRISPR-associated protein Cse1/CasA, partial [Streptomyces alkaliphilus]|uniref:type I-E CRISPR-associated protein Cse1/CasA n=1 Tax=Streptomyces alkaliphilus TaxID=1472722 RepID=UPI00117BEB36|nr:type I-E CRISPR-associated protein Cse1/CasA [Streptomyces alkaliphilus]